MLTNNPIIALQNILDDDLVIDYWTLFSKGGVIC